MYFIVESVMGILGIIFSKCSGNIMKLTFLSFCSIKRDKILNYTDNLTEPLRIDIVFDEDNLKTFHIIRVSYFASLYRSIAFMIERYVCLSVYCKSNLDYYWVTVLS